MKVEIHIEYHAAGYRVKLIHQGVVVQSIGGLSVKGADQQVEEYACMVPHEYEISYSRY